MKTDLLMSDAPAIVWFRQDLRLADNPALTAALASKRPLILLYILDDETPGQWRMGGASRWWLHRSLVALSRDVASKGGALTLRRGVAEGILAALVETSGASAIYWNRCYEPYAIARDKRLKETLRIEVKSFNGALMHEPWEVKTKTNEPYKVFTPYWRAAQQLKTRPPAPTPRKLPAAPSIASDDLESWELLPKAPNWAKTFEPEWTPGEAGAAAALSVFINQKLKLYADSRDLLGSYPTSRLSPHLHFGEISPIQVRAAIDGAVTHEPNLQRSADKFLSELGWREFSTNLLFNWPTLPVANWRSQFDAFPWRDDDASLEAWRRGRTGYPVVDAAMRELWVTGTMHNRARMIAASFQIKHLLIDWRRGEEWFWDTLLDADLANHAASWQWVAGSGADAAPYFRIFNPVTQGERYDADGAYVRRWLPVLAGLPDAWLHRPWEAPAEVLRDAGLELGRDYPRPIVDHAAGRARALAALAEISSGS